MKRFSEQLNKKSLTVKLRAAEKRELRERVVSYMEYHPLPADMKATTSEKKTATTTNIEDYREVAVPWKLITRWAVGTFALILMVVPFMAERSVPGDGLYAIKRFNEEVRETLAFDTIEKVEWETERLNRRIAEARLLASEGRLTDEVEAEVAEAVRTHSDNAQKNIDVLRTEDADEATLAAIAFETTLSMQSAALQEDEEINEGDIDIEQKKLSLLATAVEESRVETTASNASSTIPAFDKVMAKVEQNTTRVYELLDSLHDSASDQHIAKITRRLEDIGRSVDEAISLREGDDNGARALLVDSLQRTQKLIVFMTDIDVSSKVDIESIVPIVLTDQEEQKILTDYLTEFNELTTAITEALENPEDNRLSEKAAVLLEEATAIMSNFSTTTEFTTAEETIVSALDLLRNIYVLLAPDAEDEVIDENEGEPIEVGEEIGSSTEPVATTTDEVIEDESDTNESVPTDETSPTIEDGTLGATTTPTTTPTTTAISTREVDTQ